MKFSKEPIIWIGFIVALLMVVSDYLNGTLGLETFDALLVASGALIGRNFVVPWTKFKEVQFSNERLARELNRKDDEGV